MVKVDESNVLKDPEVTFTLSDITAPANDILGDDLGGEEIRGGIGTSCRGIRAGDEPVGPGSDAIDAYPARPACLVVR